MDKFLKMASFLMITLLLGSQILLRSPYRPKLTDDSLNGRTLKTYETLIYRGTITLNVLGEYIPNTAFLLINGIAYKTIDAFPVEMSICDGDVVEIQLKTNVSPIYVFLSSQKGQLITDLKGSTVLVRPGITRIFKVRASIDS